MDFNHLSKVKPNSDSTLAETYVFHLLFAWKLTGTLIVLGVVGLIHGLIPFIFTDTISNRIKRMVRDLDESRNNLNNGVDVG